MYGHSGFIRRNLFNSCVSFSPSDTSEYFLIIVLLYYRFAQNAKKIKNKPEVNQIMTDSAIMRKMEREIRNLQLELERLRKSVNSEEQEKLLMDKIEQKEHHMIRSTSSTIARATDMARRRTWCASGSTDQSHSHVPIQRTREEYGTNLPVLPTFFSIPLDRRLEDQNVEDELFQSASNVNLDQSLSPSGRTTASLSAMIKTPREMRDFIQKDKGSPNVNSYESTEELRCRIKFLEDELQEMNDFRKVEQSISADPKMLKQKLKCATDKNASLELTIEELQSALAAKTSDALVKEANAERDNALKAKVLAESISSSIEYEYEQFKAKARKRENELVTTLDDVRNEHRKVDHLSTSQTTENPLVTCDTNLRHTALEVQLQTATEDCVRLNETLAEKREQIKKLKDEYDEVSAQLMDAIQENDISIKKIEQFEEVKTKHQLMQNILETVNNEDESLPDIESNQQDDSIDQIIHLWYEVRDLRKTASRCHVLEAEILQLHDENAFLKNYNKLPIIEEVCGESQLTELTITLEENALDLSALQKAIDVKSNEILDLSEQLKDKSAKITEMEQSIEEKEMKIKEMEEKHSAQAADMTSEISALKEGLQSILTVGQENDRLKTAEKEHKQMVHDLSMRLDAIQQNKEKLQQEHTQRINELQLNEANSKIKFDALEMEVAQNEKERSNLQEQYAMLLEENKAMKLDIAEASQIKHDEQETKTEMSTSSNPTEDEHKIKAETSTSPNTTEEFESIVRAADQELAELRDRLQSKDDENEELKNKLKTTQELKLAAQKSLQEESCKLQQADAEMSRLMSDASEEISQLKKSIESLCDERVALLSEVTAANSKVQGYAEDLKESQSSADIAAGELEAFKTKFDSLLTQLDSKEKTINTLENYIRAKDQELSELQQNSIPKENKEIENLKRQLTAADQEKQKLIKQMETLETNCTAQLDKLNQLEQEAVEISKLKTQQSAAEQKILKLDAESTNLRSKLFISEEDLVNVRQQLTESSKECEEAKNRLRRRSSDNDKKLQALEVSKRELVQQIGAVEGIRAHVEQELRQLQSEYSKVTEQQFPKLRAEINEFKESKNKSEDLRQKLEQEIAKLRKELSSSESQLDYMRKTSDGLKTENELLSKRIGQLNADSIKAIAELSNERDKLIIEINILKSLSSKPPSPENRGSTRKSTDLYASQNQQLLLEARTPPARALERHLERKNRRQGAHDERRRLSSWERFTDTGVQTDAVSEICACSDLTEKVKELQIQVRQKDCKIQTMKRMAEHNPLKLDVEEQKRLLLKEQRSHNHTKATLNEMICTVADLEHEMLTVSKKSLKKEMTSQSAQTTDFDLVEKVRLHFI